MIALTRIRTLTAIPALFRGAKRKEREKTLLEKRREWALAGSQGSFAYLESKLWKTAKKQLGNETAALSPKCAYCEMLAKSVSHCDVEHIRPKATYWWLALCWENYVFSCQLCNQTAKNDNYPIHGPALMPVVIDCQTTDADIAALVDQFAPDPLDDDAVMKRADHDQTFRAEKPGLLCPYYDDPEKFLKWDADADQKRVAAAPRHNTGDKHLRATETIDLLQLNREELLNARWQVFRPIDALCRALASNQLDAALTADTTAVLVEALDSSHVFAAMCRFVIREQHGLPL